MTQKLTLISDANLNERTQLLVLHCGDKRVLLSICNVSVCVGLMTTHVGRFHITSTISIIQYIQSFSVYIQIGIVPLALSVILCLC